MSRNAKKITKALAEKGYQPREMHWEPVGNACEMCGPEGGWYIDVETVAVDEYGDHDYVGTILAYSTAEALEGIAALPEAAQAGEGGQTDANEPLTLEQLREMDGEPLWKEEPPRGDMTESKIEPVLFNGIHSGNEERACWVTGEAHRANARIEYIVAGQIRFYRRKPEGSENDE